MRRYEKELIEYRAEISAHLDELEAAGAAAVRDEARFRKTKNGQFFCHVVAPPEKLKVLAAHFGRRPHGLRSGIPHLDVPESQVWVLDELGVRKVSSRELLLAARS